MRSIPWVMTCDVLRRGRWNLITAILAANALPVLLFSALEHDGALDPAAPAQIRMHVCMVPIHLLVFGTFMLSAIGPPSRLYALPIRTSSLVLIEMLLAMAAISAELAVSTALLNAAFGLKWPLLGPVLFAAVTVAVVQAVLWLTEKSGWVILAMTCAIGVLLLWFNSHYCRVFSSTNHYWTIVTPLDGLTMVLAALGAYAIAVAAVARNRCGQSPVSLGWVAWLNRLFTAPRPAISFHSPADALLWFEWRTKGRAMPAMVLTGMLVGLVIWAAVERRAEALYAGFVAGGTLIALGGLFDGFVVGNVGRGDTDLRIGQFLATRPVTTTQMARSMLNCAAKGVVIAWVLWAVPFLALAAILRAFPVTFSLNPPAPFGWWYLPGTLVGAWAAIAILSPVILAGRQNLSAVLVFGSMSLFVGLLLFSKFALTHDEGELLFQGALIFCGIALVVGTFAAFFAAHRRAFIGATTLWTAAIAWGGLCALLGVHWISHPAVPLYFELLAAGILALAVSPWATAPLALAWNRNR